MSTTERFIVKYGLDAGSNTIINTASPVGSTDLMTLGSASSASRLSAGTLNGSAITIQTTNLTTTGSTPAAATLAAGVIAVNSFDGTAWFMSNGLI